MENYVCCLNSAVRRKDRPFLLLKHKAVPGTHLSVMSQGAPIHHWSFSPCWKLQPEPGVLFYFFCKHERYNKAYLQEAGNRGLTILFTADLLVDQIACCCSSRVQDDSKDVRVCVQSRTFNLQYNGKAEMQSHFRLCVFSVEMAGPQCHQQPAQVLLPKTSRTFVYKW